MADDVEIRLEPLGVSCRLPEGTSLQDALFREGVEFPCGGRGRCRGCRVHLRNGTTPVTSLDRQRLTDEERSAGWRLGCQIRAAPGLVLEIAQWETVVLGDETALSIRPREGLGLAIDLGTTTIVMQLVDLQSGQVLAVESGVNAQARHGADIMSRLEYAVRTGPMELTARVHRQVRTMIDRLLKRVDAGCRPALREAVLVGNTVMRHLFLGADVTSLSVHPFAAGCLDEVDLPIQQLGWDLADMGLRPDRVRLRIPPGLESFVGSDVLAGALAVGLRMSERPAALLDLGTNGEILLGNGSRMVCTSTAAGPAFEGARISRGMRAATGAISAVTVRDGRPVCQVIGGGVARGLCGSGLVDAVAAGLDLGWITSNGRMTVGSSMSLADGVTLDACDVRELQLAKGAIVAGLELLCRHWGCAVEDLAAVHLAGAFGNTIRLEGARRIGLVPTQLRQVRPAGNTALLGARCLLLGGEEIWKACRRMRATVEHVSLNEDAEFQEVFIRHMGFPDGNPPTP